MIWPGATIGCLGGGQLGKMLGMEARRLGYGFKVFEPGDDCPAAQVADTWERSPYESVERLEAFARACDILTYEFENIPCESLEALSSMCPLLPEPSVLHICQNREREKTFLQDRGFPCAAFRIVDSLESCQSAVQALGVPCVLKTAAWGYDGKGQRKICTAGEVDAAWESFSGDRAVVEEWVDFIAECSVICARNREGHLIPFPVAENRHRDHILEMSIVPARLDPSILTQVSEMAASLTAELKVVGLLAVEFFIRADGRCLVNEMAPRPHNSGHYTLDACSVSQFEQHVRLLTDLPPAAPRLQVPAAVMVNLLGDLWQNGLPAWNELLSHPGTHLHLYGKKTPRPGRKMGHFTVVGPEVGPLIETARSLHRQCLPTSA